MDGSGAAAQARIGGEGYRVEVEAGGFPIVADEPVSAGGGGAGPDPFALLYASLASCVLMTIRMYAARKQWGLESSTRSVPGASRSTSRTSGTLVAPTIRLESYSPGGTSPRASRTCTGPR